MKAYVYAPDGKVFRLEPCERPVPEPHANEVVVRVRACSLNYRDLIFLRGESGRALQGMVPLSDGAGEVVAVGSAVNGLRIGDRVAGCFFQDWTDGRFELSHHVSDLGGGRDGMLSEYVALPESGVVPIPTYLSYAEAATLPCAAVTAWQALFTRGGFEAGRSVLALGTGGVSVFAAQLAIAGGGTALITSKSDAKLQRLRTLGVAHGINYRTTPDWEKEIWRLTNKRGVDHVIEVGGPGTIDKSIACIAAGGQIAMIGVLTGFGPTSARLFPVLTRNARMDGIYVGSRKDFLALNAFLAAHSLHPVIDRTFPFDQASAALDYLASGEHVGKVTIDV